MENFMNWNVFNLVVATFGKLNLSKTSICHQNEHEQQDKLETLFTHLHNCKKIGFGYWRRNEENK